MKIRPLLLIAFVFLALSCHKNKVDEKEPGSNNVYKAFIDSVITQHHQFYKEVASEHALDTILANAQIGGRYLFKNRNGGMTGYYGLLIEGKLSSTYRILITEGQNREPQFYLLKRNGKVIRDSIRIKEHMYDVINRRGETISEFRISDLFNLDIKRDSKLSTTSTLGAESLNFGASLMWLMPSELPYVNCPICAYQIEPDESGYYADCECPHCGIQLIYPPTFWQYCSIEGEPINFGESTGGGGGGGPYNAPVVYQFLNYLTLSQSWINYLNQNQEVGADLYLALYVNDGSDAAIQATKATLDALVANKIDGPYDLSHSNMWAQSIPGLQVNSPIHPQMWAYFTAQCAIIKIQNPTWSKARIYWEAVKDVLHTGLDVVGLIPVAGELADLANGIIYTIEGDGVNASLSFAATIPIAGWGATATKFAKKAIVALDGSTRTLNWIKLTNGVIEFGDRRLLRKVLGLAKNDARAAHHIIPWEHGTSDLVQKAAVGNSTSFHLNEALNGIPLTAIQHNGSHALYSQRVNAKLTSLWELHGGPNMSPEQARNLLEDLIDDIRTAITSNPNTPINDIIF